VIANLDDFPLFCFLLSQFQLFPKIGSRQVQKAEELHQAGLLNKEGLAKVWPSWPQ